MGCVISSFAMTTFETWGTCFIVCGLVIILVGMIDIVFMPNLPPDALPLLDGLKTLNILESLLN